MELCAGGGEEVDFVGCEDELAVWGNEGEFAGTVAPAGETHAGVEDGEFEAAGRRGAEFLGVRGLEGEEEVGDAREFGGEGDGAVGACGEGTAGGRDGGGDELDEVDVEFVVGVADVGAAPGDSGELGGGGGGEGCAGGVSMVVHYVGRRVSVRHLGRPVTLLKSFPIKLGGSTTSLNAFGSVVNGNPSSHISFSSCATIS